MADEVVDDKTLNEEMDESIRATLHDIQSRQVADDEVGIVDIVNGAEKPASAEPAKDRAREPDGKFAKEPKEATPIAAEKTAEPVNPETAPAAVAAEATQPALDINRPPSSWKPAAKAAWAALPETVRAEIYRREGDFHTTVLRGPLKENADFGQSVKSVIEPYRALILAEGGTPERAIADTMRTAALFRTGSQQSKLQALFDIDKQYNAGLVQHFQNAVAAEVAKATGQTVPVTQQPPQTFTDPRVDSILASIQAQNRERSQQAEQTANSAVEQFISAKNPDGQPKYPFVDNVIDDLNARVSLIRGQNPGMEQLKVLERAYDEAVWANPETRAVLIGQQQAAAAQPADNLRKVEAAKRASAVNVPKRGALPATGPVKSIEETIRETAQALGMF